MRLLFLIPLLALTTRAEDESLMTIHRIETETADRIQARVLDPILGPGQSSVFVKLKLEMKREREVSDRSGEGRSTTFRIKNELTLSTSPKTAGAEKDSWFWGIGLTDATRLPYQQSSGHQQAQEASQMKGSAEERIAISGRYASFRLVILHDAKIAPSRIAAVRGALLAVYRSENADIKFHPVEFSALK